MPLATELTPSYYSAGRLTEITQVATRELRLLLAARGIQPKFYQDDVDFYDGVALLELQAILREQNQ